MQTQRHHGRQFGTDARSPSLWIDFNTPRSPNMRRPSADRGDNHASGRRSQSAKGLTREQRLDNRISLGRFPMAYSKRRGTEFRTVSAAGIDLLLARLQHSA